LPSKQIVVLDWQKSTKEAQDFSNNYPEMGFKQLLVSVWVSNEDHICKQGEAAASHYKRVSVTQFPQIDG
jgi:hypothetical protein